jgi:hypothetical protein
LDKGGLVAAVAVGKTRQAVLLQQMELQILAVVVVVLAILRLLLQAVQVLLFLDYIRKVNDE